MKAAWRGRAWRTWPLLGLLLLLCGPLPLASAQSTATTSERLRSKKVGAKKSQRNSTSLKKNRGKAPRYKAVRPVGKVPLPSLELPKTKRPLPAKTPMEEPSLDLSAPLPAANDKRARQELLGGSAAKPGSEAGGIDFGNDYSKGAATGGKKGSADSFDFGADKIILDLGAVGKQTVEQKRFEAAMNLMTREAYAAAAQEFKYFQGNTAYAMYAEETAYQLAKSLYKMNFYEPALQQFTAILKQGEKHTRYRKAVEWLFFMSRKLADQTPVLAQLAQYRNVTFPPAYRNEYHYLLAKYLFSQADEFEVKRLQEEEFNRGKSSKEAGFDFGAVAQAIAGGDAASGSQGIDFAKVAHAEGLDFGASSAPNTASSLDFGSDNAAGLDFDSSRAAASRYAIPTNAQEAIRQGLELIEQVEVQSSFYPRARYLKGLMHYLSGNDQLAVEDFQEVVRVLNTKQAAKPEIAARMALQADPQLRERAFLSLARLHYGHKQFDRAVYYYDLIDRDGDNWLTSLFESSWAYYRRGDFEKSLGKLLTLHAPFFVNDYFPESQMVEAIIYFEACRYVESRSIVDTFLTQFTAVLQEIQQVAHSTEAPERLVAKVNLDALNQPKRSQAMAPGASDVSARVLSLTLASPEIRQALAVLQQLRAQKKLLLQFPNTFRQSDLGGEIAASLNRAETERTSAAGKIIKKSFEQEEFKLKSLLAQALRIKIEIAGAEREVLEKTMQQQATTEEIVPAVAHTVVDDEHVFWPYEGEYWRDELGNYEIDFSMCQQVASE